MALKDLYSLYDTQTKAAKAEWDRLYEMTDSGQINLRGNMIPAEGVGAFNSNPTDFLRSQGYVPLDNILAYGLKETGLTIPKALGPGTLERVEGTGFENYSDPGTAFYKPNDPNWMDTHGIRLPTIPTGGAIGAFGDAWSGGLNMVLGGALGGMLASAGGLSGLFGGEGIGSIAADIPFDVGANLVNNPEVFGGGNMSFFPDVIDAFDLGGDMAGGPSIFDAGFSQGPQFDWLTGEWANPVDPNMSFPPGGSAGNPGGNNWLTGTSASSGWGSGLDFSSGLNTDMLSKLKNLLTGENGENGTGSSLAKTLLGNGGLGGLLGEGGLFGTALSLAPSLAAINYARNLGGPDTSRLESLYNNIGSPDTSRLESAYSSIDPNALAFPYDIQTGKGREALTSSLTSRGIMGSSFANQDLSGYDTMRGLGRSNLLTSGAGAQADIASRILQARQAGYGTQANVANQILAAQQKAEQDKLDLYGRSLLALSGGLNPARSGAYQSRGIM